jgi:hypothetical protein
MGLLSRNMDAKTLQLRHSPDADIEMTGRKA